MNKMKHAFSNVSNEQLIVAIQCLMTFMHDGKHPTVMLQISTDGQFVATLGDRLMSDPETGKPRRQRVISSPDFAHLIWSALNENHEALTGFKKLTGWKHPGIEPLTKCAAHQDGDCSHVECPQHRDDEPRNSGRHCPLDNESSGD